MRIVLDTNVLIAAFVARGVCHELFEHCALNHQIVLSPVILEEFRTTLTRKLHFAGKDVSEAIGLLRSRASVVKPDPLSSSVRRDPDDDNIPATAVTAQCDCIVTGDGDLLASGQFREIPILSPGAFWDFERGAGNR